MCGAARPGTMAGLIKKQILKHLSRSVGASGVGSRRPCGGDPWAPLSSPGTGGVLASPIACSPGTGLTGHSLPGRLLRRLAEERAGRPAKAAGWESPATRRLEAPWSSLGRSRAKAEGGLASPRCLISVQDECELGARLHLEQSGSVN